jgi:hypothetical protein
MKTETIRNSALALVGLVALSIYIMACTSFSPDDSKVLYPAFESTNGMIGVAVYDRAKAVSDMAFVPALIGDTNVNHSKPTLMRAQWMPDGGRILIAWSGDDAPDGMTLALMPWNTRAPLKLFCLPKVEGSYPARPLCIAGDRVFLMESKDTILRLDLKTGEIARHTFEGVKPEIGIVLWPVPNDQGVFYAQGMGENSGTVFGRLNPDDFSLTPVVSFTNDFSGGSFFAFDSTGRRCAFVEKERPLPPVLDATGGKPLGYEDEWGLTLPQLVVLKDGREVLRRPIGAKDEELGFISAEFSKRGDSILAGFERAREGQPGISFGLMEIPLGDQPVRETILIADSAANPRDNACSFQFAISHDGKTAAAASTYLAVEHDNDFKREDCALFLIDLSDPKWKVTKVPIPLPDQWVAPADK